MSMDAWEWVWLGLGMLGALTLFVFVVAMLASLVLSKRADNRIEVMILSKFSPIDDGMPLVDSELDDLEDQRTKIERARR